MTHCNCNDPCYRCDIGNQGDDCTCFNPCHVHQPEATARDEPTFSPLARAERQRNNPRVEVEEKAPVRRNHLTGEVLRRASGPSCPTTRTTE